MRARSIGRSLRRSHRSDQPLFWREIVAGVATHPRQINRELSPPVSPSDQPLFWRGIVAGVATDARQKP